MGKPILRLTTIPFEGFYESRWSQEIDQQESDFIEYHTDAGNGEIDPDYEGAYAPELRLTDWDYQAILHRHTSYGDACRAIAQDYVAAFNVLASEEIGLPLKLEFESMSSPREYNFETDRLFAYIPLSVVKRLFAASKAEKHVSLCAAIKDRFTPCSGFIPHYSASLAEWLATPLADWDHNEIGTLLIAAMMRAGIEENEFGWSLFETVGEGSGFYQVWSNAVDWMAFEAERNEMRQDKAAELAEEDPERAAELGISVDGMEPLPIRCPYTLEMTINGRRL
jgi:hypothetical protein